MREPDLSRDNRRAWKCDGAATEPAHAAHLVTYLVNFPGAHRGWEYWMVATVHLRDIPGVRPANKSYPDAAYEFGIHTIDPEKHPGEIDPDRGAWALLSPPDSIVQFHGVDDDQAAELCLLSVKLMIERGYSPDSDFRAFWKEAIWSTIEHMTVGHHKGGRN